METVNIFAYGILCSPETVWHVTGQEYDMVDATLFGYTRYKIVGAPALIIPDERSFVPGKLLLNVGPCALARLDRLEGEGWMYHRTKGEVTNNQNGTVHEAQFYVAGKQLAALGRAIKEGRIR